MKPPATLPGIPRAVAWVTFDNVPNHPRAVILTVHMRRRLLRAWALWRWATRRPIVLG